MIQRRANSEQDFINQVDKVSQDSTTPPQEVAKKAKKGRKYISHTLQMTEEEYLLLKTLAEQYCQSHSGMIRYALKALSEKK